MVNELEFDSETLFVNVTDVVLECVGVECTYASKMGYSIGIHMPLEYKNLIPEVLGQACPDHLYAAVETALDMLLKVSSMFTEMGHDNEVYTQTQLDSIGNYLKSIEESYI